MTTRRSTARAVKHRFEEWATEAEPRLRQALVAAFGQQVGVEVTAEALAYAWENFEDVLEKANPVGYVYGVARNLARRAVAPRRVVFPPVAVDRTPDVEPGLPAAVAGLPEQQRIVVTLLYGFEWTMSEVAEFLDIAKTSVQNHAERGLRTLRSELGVAQ
ncbi:MAG: sigma-70 family RNA polymerase sigma factor [Actinomycetota bacterium]